MNKEAIGLCVCGRPIVDIRWSSHYKGLITIPVGFSHRLTPSERQGKPVIAEGCCSLYEGEYDSPEQAARQIASAKDYARKRQEEYGIPHCGMRFIEEAL